VDAEPETPATLALRGADLQVRVVRTTVPSSAEESASLQGIEVGRLLRSIVVRRSEDDYLFVLVPGGRRIEWARLRRHLGVSRLSLPDADEVRGATGYERGAVTPFGSARPWPTVADATIPGSGLVAIGAGERGVNLHVDADELLRHLEADVADVTDPAGDPERG
jgi:Cys-tRNA(Pro) deacylase